MVGVLGLVRVHVLGFLVLGVFGFGRLYWGLAFAPTEQNNQTYAATPSIEHLLAWLIAVNR